MAEEENKKKYVPQCSQCQIPVAESTAAYVTSCGHIFCAKCFKSSNYCSICQDACDVLNIEDTEDYPDLHKCLFADVNELIESLQQIYTVNVDATYSK